MISLKSANLCWMLAELCNCCSHSYYIVSRLFSSSTLRSGNCGISCPRREKPSSKADGQKEQKQLCLKQWLNLSNQIYEEALWCMHWKWSPHWLTYTHHIHIVEYTGSSAAEFTYVIFMIKHFETLAGSTGAWEPETASRHPRIVRAPADKRTGDEKMWDCDAHASDTWTFSHFSSRLETKRDHDRSKCMCVILLPSNTWPTRKDMLLNQPESTRMQ